MRIIAIANIWKKISDNFFTPQHSVGSVGQKTAALLIPLLFIALVFVSVRLFSTHWPGTTEARTVSTEVSSAVVDSGDKINWEIPELYPTTLRDPMQFGSAKSGINDGNLIVRGIVYSEDNPSAIIDSQIRREGDKVAGAVNTKINRTRVEFEMNGKKWTQKVQR